MGKPEGDHFFTELGVVSSARIDEDYFTIRVGMLIDKGGQQLYVLPLIQHITTDNDIE